MINKSVFGRLAIVVLLSISLVSLLALRDYQRFVQQPLSLESETSYTVPKGQSQTALIQSWAQNGWLEHAARDEIWLKLRARTSGIHKTIKAGRYRLRPGQTVLAALSAIQNGAIENYTFTIVEGWNFQRLRDELAQQPHITSTITTWSAQDIMQAIDKPDQHPEGQFLPETYQYNYLDSDLSILQQASEALDSYLAKAWATRQAELPLTSAYEGLILASIIEKETARADERALIAGVFINRLNRGMRLQTDPTVIYGLGDAFDGDLRRRDLRRDTPYNTYTRKGLPPTPIALAGPASISAAMNPEKTDKLFFVATKKAGRHYFSATLSEHEAAVKRYQLK